MHPLLIPGYTAGASQKPRVSASPLLTPPALPVRMNASPSHGSWIKVACSPLFLLHVVFAPPHTVFQMLSDIFIIQMFSSSASFFHQKSKSCLSLAVLVAYPTLTYPINHKINPWMAYRVKSLLLAGNLHGGHHVPHTCMDLLLLFSTHVQMSGLGSIFPDK